LGGAKDVGLVVLYRVGGDHDPMGRSGLWHMVEHAYVTAAAGKEKARTAEAFFKRYPKGANAQTGNRYTVIATVFPKADLEKELGDAAARMGDLRITTDDLAREKPRIIDEVANMFGALPQLGAWNHARELVRPTPVGGRRGGVPEQVKALTLEEVLRHWKRYYKPRNAILVLAGAVDVKAARKQVTERFGKLPAGEKAPAPHEPGKPRPGEVREVSAASVQPKAKAHFAIAYAAPAPGSKDYAPFLVLVARLWTERALGGADGPQVYYLPLDGPAVIAVAAPLKAGETSKQAVARLEKMVAKATGPKRDKEDLGNDLVMAHFRFATQLGTADLSARVFASNPYLAAFSVGRREQLGIDPTKLGKALDAVTGEDLRRVARAVFSPRRHAAAVVSPRERAP
jgi:zinc protease